MSDWEEAEDVSETTCDHCGKVRPCIRSGDPFVQEVYLRRTRKSWWCYDCYRDRKDDI